MKDKETFQRVNQKYLKFGPSPFPSPLRREGGVRGDISVRDKFSDFNV